MSKVYLVVVVVCCPKTLPPRRHTRQVRQPALSVIACPARAPGSIESICCLIEDVVGVDAGTTGIAGCSGGQGRHPEIEEYRVIRLQSTADRESPTQPLQRVRENVGITRDLMGKVSPGKLI
jgi:hypothetical protein